MLKTRIQKWENGVGYAQFLGFEAFGILFGIWSLGFGISAAGRGLEFPRPLARGVVEHFVSRSVEDCEDWTLKL